MTAQQRGVLRECYSAALQGAARFNPQVELLPGGRARVKHADGTYTSLTNSTQGVRLVFALTGCSAVRQHYRCCTPHALNKLMSLHCFFCNYDEGACVAAGRQRVPASELRMMRALASANITEQVCWQPCVPWWDASVDFMFLERSVIIQADGDSHFRGTYQQSSVEQLCLDAAFCARAVSNGVSVIRVHDADLQSGLNPTILRYAVSVATMGVCVVLSHAYTRVWWYEGSKPVTYIDKLKTMLGASSVYRFNTCTLVKC